MKVGIEKIARLAGLPSDWKISFGSLQGNDQGICFYQAKRIVIRNRRREDDVVQTVYHEVAHVFTVGHGHDKVFWAKVVEIGGRLFY
jgi:hypothetical protein